MLRTSRLLKALVLLASVAAVLAVLFQVVYRPWQRNWGSTEQEVNRRMPGDEIIAAPTFIATRAVTIRGRPKTIWPWIVQIGYKRAGFYSWDRLDNDGIPSAERILPEFQNLATGDQIPLSEDADAQVRELTPNRSLLLLYGHDSDSDEVFTWAWGLYPLDREHTRLVTRLRWRPHGPFAPLLLDAVEIVMMRKCLLGIKRRVEASTPSQRPQATRVDVVGSSRFVIAMSKGGE
ncbi:MAG: hypothetical protein GY769_04195 [bacterium]|nr:hypothetical protein [bacterium]